MKKNLMNFAKSNLNRFGRIFILPAALLLSVGFSACDSTREVTEDDDPGVEVSDTAVTDPDTTGTTK